jgi:hypothetical protein
MTIQDPRHRGPRRCAFGLVFLLFAVALGVGAVALDDAPCPAAEASGAPAVLGVAGHHPGLLLLVLALLANLTRPLTRRRPSLAVSRRRSGIWWVRDSGEGCRSAVVDTASAVPFAAPQSPGSRVASAPSTASASGPTIHHPYVIAKVYARFPEGGGGVVIPPRWVDAAMTYEDPLEGESAEHTVREGARVRLGVDIAADGGDEFTIFRSVGDAVEFRHTSAGAANDNQVSVAEKVLEEIHAAQRLADTLNSPHPVRVKLDQNGIDHDVVSMLQRWAETSRHRAQIVGVMVSESPIQNDPGAIMRPWRKRDDMWLATRSLLQPDPSSGRGRYACTSTRRPPRSSPPRNPCRRRAATPRSSRRKP